MWASLKELGDYPAISGGFVALLVMGSRFTSAGGKTEVLNDRLQVKGDVVQCGKTCSLTVDFR